MATEEVVLTIRNGRVMRVRRGAKAEFVRIESLGVLQGEGKGCVSEVPLSWCISVSFSLRSRDAAHAASTGRPLISTSVGNMRPSERFALCEIASTSLPALRCVSIQLQSSHGSTESSALNGTAGTLALSLKKILRWRFMLFGIEVHS